MNNFTGTRRLFKLAVRRDRIKLSIAILAIGVLTPLMVSGIKELITGQDPQVAKQLMALLAANPATRLFGLPTGGDIGNLLMLRAYTFIGIVMALTSTFTVIRHTRQNEELGRTELIVANVVGRYASLAAALIISILVNLIISGLVFFTLYLEGLPPAGSLAMALGLGGTGICFAGIAALCAQLSGTSRGANSLASAAVGAAFLLCGVGSVLGELAPNGLAVEPTWATWLSPMGWGQLLYPFAEERWSMVFVFAAFSAVVIFLSIQLSNMRDIGGSILPAPKGKLEASKSLLSIPGMTWRLNRAVFFGWIIGLTLLASIYGAVAGSIEQILSEAGGVAQIFLANSGSENILTVFLGVVTSILGIGVLAYAIQIMTRLRSEENRALEFLLTSSVHRYKWALTVYLFAIASSAVILITSCIVGGVIFQNTVESGIGNVIMQMAAGGLVQLPAIIALCGIVMLVFGLLPRFTTALAWAITSVSILLSPFFGSLLSLPKWVLNVSPLSHTPAVPPLENIEILPLVILTAIGIVAVIGGLFTFKARDIDMK